MALPPPHHRTTAAGVNALGTRLLVRLADRAPATGNVFLSPASIASALALALAGAPPESETARCVCMRDRGRDRDRESQS
jgi:serine protease inhibitor